ncbi:MAG: DUF1992 domain-containing protein [Caldilineaceae bacterium]|nr:DUF1992 domain-containing protein [Caldilineaceae bacterium]
MSEKPKPLSPSQLRAERQLSAEIPPSTARHPRGADEWQDFISQRIEDAMREGAFDNLSGKGKPLKLNENPNEPPEMAMANKILQNNDVTPPWIGDRKKLLEDIETLRAEMSQRWEWMREDWATPTADRERLVRRWTDQIASWADQIAKLNGRILNLNLILPIWRMELLRLHLADELKHIGAPERLGEEG